MATPAGLAGLEVAVLSEVGAKRPGRAHHPEDRGAIPPGEAIGYDTGDTHYDVASALIKSMRGERSGRGAVLAGPDAGSGKIPGSLLAASRFVRPKTSGTPTLRRRSWRRGGADHAGRSACRSASLRSRRPPCISRARRNRTP